jgi:hypothetical protein
MDTIDSAFSARVFECKSCDIVCSKKNDWDRHVLTRKHLARVVGNELDMEIPRTDFGCICGKTYANNSGLWKHSKKCNSSMTSDEKEKEEDIDMKKIMFEIVKSNAEIQKQQNDLQKQMNDIYKNNTIITQNNINSNNKTFNLMFFLNEQCKDAMNISEFVDSFDLQLEDLESVGELGYVDGITKIMVDKLNSMDIYKRPIHCSDAKREILYIKDDNRWEREKRDNPKLRKAIKSVSFKNMKLAPLWSDTYPESKSSESNLNDVYITIIIQSTGGKGEISISENKIIKKIAREIVIDKSLIMNKH